MKSPPVEVERHGQLDGRAVVALVLCCALWGLNQIAIKAALPEVASLTQLSVRSVSALLLVLAWMRWKGVGWSLAEDARAGLLLPGLACGTLFAVEFACIFVGLQFTSAARAVVFINTSPFVVALLLAWRLPSERLRPLQVAGLVLALSAVAYAVSDPRAQAQAPRAWLGDALVLLGALLWGLTTVTIRLSALRNAPFEKTLGYQLLVSAVLSPPAAWLAGESWPTAWSGLALASLAYQAAIVTFASYLLWFWLLTRYPATRVQSFVFLSPVFGAIFAVLLLGEALEPRLILALVGVAVGITMVNRARRV